MKKILLIIPFVCYMTHSMQFRHSVMSSSQSRSVQLDTAVVIEETVEEKITHPRLHDLGVTEYFSCLDCLKKHKALLINDIATSIKNITKNQIDELFDSLQNSIGSKFDSTMDFFNSVPNKPLAFKTMNDIIYSDLTRDQKIEQVKALLILGNPKGRKRVKDLGLYNIFAYYVSFAVLKNEQN